MNTMTVYVAGGLLGLFFAPLLGLLVPKAGMFFTNHGRYHALTGGVFLGLLLLGMADALLIEALNPAPSRWLLTPALGVPRVVYDLLLNALGIVLTLTAAFEFKHKRVQNVASGTLDQHATVTHGEMLEHSFYQGLNLVQIAYLHGISLVVRPPIPFLQALLPADVMAHLSPEMLELMVRLVCCLGSALPWLARDLFPVNKFSDNYTKMDERSTPLVRLLYRIKKYQYVFYKHFLLHGLNISVAWYGLYDLPHQQFFRLYWMSLNTSYVMEFFLQTLVKKKHMTQDMMLALQKVLMTEATLVALYVLKRVNLLVALSSLALNFLNRKHDVTNCLIIVLGIVAHQAVSSFLH